jgi:GTP-binding protein
MFTDELRIYAKAGNGGDGVVRWRQEKFKPRGGPAGGNGGNGGGVYLRAVSDINRLNKYVGNPEFKAADGVAGQNQSQHGANADDLVVDIPVGSVVTDEARDRTYTFTTIGQTEQILRGGRGGLGNEYFKSSTNRTPMESTDGKTGEDGYFTVEVALMVDVGFIGLPNAGKSSLLNALTNATARIGAYPFTTLTPHLGDLYGHTLADIPGLISGAASGKGLGHRFLRHVTRTRMLVHVLSLESTDLQNDYQTIQDELSQYDKTLLEKEEWIVLNKKDLVNQADIDKAKKLFDKSHSRVFVLSAMEPETCKNFQDELTAHLTKEKATEVEEEK